MDSVIPSVERVDPAITRTPFSRDDLRAALVRRAAATYAHRTIKEAAGVNGLSLEVDLDTLGYQPRLWRENLAPRDMYVSFRPLSRETLLDASDDYLSCFFDVLIEDALQKAGGMARNARIEIAASGDCAYDAKGDGTFLHSAFQMNVYVYRVVIAAKTAKKEAL